MHRRGFTLVEVLVASVLVAIAVVGVMNGIRAIEAADFKAQTADLLQRLASEKFHDLAIYADPSQSDSRGDFSDRGYPDITWSVDVSATSTMNLDQVTVTAERASDSQSLTGLVFVPPATTTSTTTTTSGSTAQ